MPGPAPVSALPSGEPIRVHEGWWFAPPGALPRRGVAHSCATPPAPGEVGLHATRSVLDALDFARSPHLCRVRLAGEIAERGPLIAATERTVLWCLDPAPLLRSIVIEIAGAVLREDPPTSIGALGERALSAAELESWSASCEDAREAMLDAESRVRDAEWRLEQRGGDLAIAAARSARRDAAAAKARLNAMDALRAAATGPALELGSAIGLGSTIGLGSAIELALRAASWSRAADLDTITARALDEIARETRARWAETIDARVIATARGVDRATPIASDPEPAVRSEQSGRPETVIAPIAMRLPPWRATPRVSATDVPAAAPERVWRHTVTDTLARLRPAVRRASIVSAPTALLRGEGPLVVVAVADPFERADVVASAIRGVVTPDGRAPGAIVMLHETLESSGPNVVLSPEIAPWAFGWRRAVLADAIAESWATSVLFDEPTRDDDDEPVAEWTSATARCHACHREYELAWGDPIAHARCACGVVGLEWIAAGPPDEEDVGDAVACPTCTRFFLRRARTAHACCPFCFRVDAPLRLDV